MANEDVVLKIGADASGVIKELKRVQSEMNASQSSVAPDTRIAQNPAALRNKIYDTTPVDLNKQTSELNKQKQIRKQMVDQQGRMLALAQQELVLVNRAAGRKTTDKELSGIRTSGQAALESRLGGLSASEKGALTKRVNQVNRDIEAALGDLSGVQRQNKFRSVAAPILQEVGITDPVRVRKASTIVGENARADVSGSTARQEQAEARQAAADERAAVVAETDAADAARSAAAEKDSRRRLEAAKNREAAAAEKRAAFEAIAAEAARNAQLNRYPKNADGARMVPVREIAENWDFDEGPLSRKLKESKEKAYGDQISLYDSISRDGVKTPINARAMGDLKDPTESRYADSHSIREGHHRVAALYDINPDAKIPVKFDDDIDPYDYKKQEQVARQNITSATASQARAAQEAANIESQALAFTQAQEAAQQTAEAQVTKATQDEAKVKRSGVAKLSAAQDKALALIQASPGISRDQLKAAGVGAGTLKALSSKELVSERDGGFTAADASDRGFDAEEAALVRALIRKREALDKQTLVLTSNYGAFAQAEAALIAALNGKTGALIRQTKAMGNIPDPIPGVEDDTPKAPASPKPSVTNIDNDGVDGTEKAAREKAAKDAEKIARDRRAKEIRQQGWNFNDTEIKYLQKLEQEEKLAAEMGVKAARDEVAAAEARSNSAAQKAALAYGGDAAAMIRADEADQAAYAAQQAAAAAEIKAATLRRQAAEFQANRTRPGNVADFNEYDRLLAESTKPFTRGQQRLAQFQKPPQAVGFLEGYEKLGVAPIYEELNPDKDRDVRIEAAQEKLAKAYMEQAALFEIVNSGLAEGYSELLGAQQALSMKIRGATAQQIVSTPEFFRDYTEGAATNKVAQAELAAGREAFIANDPALQQRLVAAQKELEGYTRQQALAYAKDIANDPARLRAEAELAIATQQLANERKRAALIAGSAETRAERELLALTERNEALQRNLKNPDFIGQEQLRAELNQQRRIVRTGEVQNPTSLTGRLTKRLGYSGQGKDTLSEFFGGGALASLRYGLPSMLLYGAASGIGDTIREAEELQYNLSRLEGQFEATFGGQGGNFSEVRSNILGVAKETGLAADEIANLQIQITGAFANETIGGVTGQDLVTQQVESAAKLAQTIGIPLAEITDGLTAASLAFEASFEEIGDVALSLEQESGVLARETVSFIGDIAPVAKEAGYSLEEFAAIATVAQQRSGRSGAALAESFGRVIPALTEQKDKLMELAAITPALQNDAFVDAIRSSDPGAILDQIGAAYGKMSKEAQQSTVSLLGGRREAQAIIPAIANQALIADYRDAAEDAAGTLEERFLKVQETLTNSLQRLGETFRQLGVTLLEAGLTETFENLISLAKILLGALTPLIGAIGSINDLFGGWPLSILLAVAAMKAFNRFALQKPQMIENSIGQMIPVRDAEGRVQRERRFNPNLSGIGAPGFVQDYRQLRRPTQPIPAALGGGTAPAGPGIGRLAAGGRVAAGGAKGLLSALGGGSAALGAGFVGITALTSLYGWANAQADKERANLKELSAEIEQGNSDLELEVPQIRESRVRDLQAQAEEARALYGGWSQMWRTVFGIMGDDELLLGKAEALDTTDLERAAIDALGKSASIRGDIFKDLAPKLGKSTRALRGIFDDYSEFADASLQEIDGTLKAVSSSGATTSLDANDTRYVTEIADLTGIEVGDLDFGFLTAALQPDNGASIIELAKGTDESIEKYGDAAVDQAQAYVEAVYGLAEGSPAYARKLDELAGLLDELPPIDQAKADAETLKSKYDLGLISLDKYITEMEKNRDTRRALLNTGTGPATDDEIMQILQDEATDSKAIADSILADQERLNSIAEVLGRSEGEQQQVTYDQAISNLRNLNFTNNEARLQAAIDALEAKKEIDLRLAQESGDIAEVNRLLLEGVTIPPEIRAEFFANTTFANDTWKSFAKDLQDVMGSPVFQRQSSPAPGARSIDSAVGRTTQFNPFAQLGGEPEEIARKLFGEFFELGELSEETSGDIQRVLDQTLAGLSEEGITNAQKQQIMGAVDGMIDFLIWIGTPEDELLDFLAGGDFNRPDRRPGETRRAAQDRVREELNTSRENGTPFIGAPPTKAELDAEADKEANDLYEANVEYRKAVAGANAYLVAQIEVEAANMERLFAEGMAPGKERDIAIVKAKTRQVEALRGIDTEAEAFADAVDEYNVASAKARGDISGAIAIEAGGLQRDLQKARDDNDRVAVKQIGAQIIANAEEQRRQGVAENQSGFSLLATLAELDGDIVRAAQLNLQKAEAALNAARGTEEINAALEAVERARSEIANAEKTVRDIGFDIFSTALESKGYSTEAAYVNLQKAIENEKAAMATRDKFAQAQAFMDRLREESAYRQAQLAQRQVQVDYFSAIVNPGGDPVAQAKIDLANAKGLVKLAKDLSPVEQAKAQIQLIEAQKQLDEAMSDARYSMFSLRQAELEAMEDSVGASQVAAELARQQLADVIKAKAGDAAINQARAAVITADKAAKDAVFNERMDEYKWLLDMGRISKSQYINYLEGLKSTLIPGSRQFKDLELTLKQLRDDIGGDLQANLPTSLALPTLYEVRRFDQTQQQGIANGPVGGIGYQDNRVMDIQITIGQNMSQDQIVSVMSDVLGVGRNAANVRRY